MGEFPAGIRDEAIRRSHFRCVACTASGIVEVHHIQPASEGGPDTLENACPLCPSCHALWGGNPERRAYLRKMRDFRWEDFAKQSAHPILDAMNQSITQLLTGHVQHQESLDDVKAKLAALYNALAGQVLHATTIQQVGALTGVATPLPPQIVLTFGTNTPKQNAVTGSWEIQDSSGLVKAITRCPGEPHKYTYNASSDTWTAR